MATVIPHLQKNFKLKVEDGLLYATVELVGSVNWVRCCPLCGSMHQVMSGFSDAPYIPMCQTHPLLFKAELLAWHKLYPEVTKHNSLHLVATSNTPTTPVVG